MAVFTTEESVEIIVGVGKILVSYLKVLENNQQLISYGTD
jgi:hypothetical protein